MKHFLIAAAAAIAFIAADEAQADAMDCVNVWYDENYHNPWGETHWVPRYWAQNNCSASVYVGWQHNTTNGRDLNVYCSAEKGIGLVSGDTGSMLAGYLPNSVSSNITYCVNWLEYGCDPGCPRLR